jgi:translation initiation factor IF-3
MVIDDSGEKLGVMPIDVALRRAEEQGLDLVEVAPEAKPPVCKILDYGKQKYLQKKKQSEAKKHTTQQELKEVKLRPKTDEHDYDFKLKHVQRFLSAGDKVKITLMFRGREVIHKDIAFKRLNRIAADVEGVGVVEVAPRMEQRFMFMILAPDKKAMARKKAQAEQKKAEAKKAERAQKAAAKEAAEAPSENGGKPEAKEEAAPSTTTEAKADA